MTEAKKREKVMRGLEAHANPKSCETCTGEECPYYNRGGSYPKVTCSSFLAAEALALLKEQEPKAAWYDSDAPLRFWHCGHCGVCITYGDQYCRICGQAVKWDD